MNQTARLNQKLEQYGVTVRGQAGRGKTTAELAGYAAAAGASLAMAGAADATIIYSGVQNISVSINPAAQATSASFYDVASTSIDMDGGGPDLSLFAGFNALGAASAAKYAGGAGVGATGGAAFLGFSGYLEGLRLPAGAIIGASGSFSASSAGRARGQIAYSGGSTSATSYGNFGSGTTGFVGIKLASGNFGWIRLRLDDLGLNQPFSDILSGLGGTAFGDGSGYPDKVTVIDWAYQSSGAAIRAGETGVPEPSSLALLAAGATGLAAFRRRKAKATAH